MSAASSLCPLRRPMAGTTPGHAPLVALLAHVAPNQATDPVAGNRVEDVLLLLRVRADVDPVHPDLENRRREAPLVVEPHSVTIRFKTRRPLSSQAFSMISRFRVPTPCAIRTVWFVPSRPSSCLSLCTRKIGRTSCRET